MNNFRVFYGNQRIEFKDDLTIISGNNGTGKTSIIEAINWCLYEISRSSILNFKAAGEDGEKTVSVICKFEDEMDIVLIERKVLFDDNNNLKSHEFNVILNDVIIANPNYFIDNTFSKQLSDLSKNSLEDNISSLKYIVAKEYGVEDLQTVKSHLNIVMKGYLKDFAKLNPRHELDSIKSLEQKLGIVSNSLEDTNMKIKEVEKLINMENITLHDLPDVKPFMIEKDMLKNKRNEVSDEIKYHEDNLTSLLIENVPLSMVYSKISSDESIDFNEIESLLYKHFPTSDLHIKESSTNEIKDSFEKIRILKDESNKISFKINEINSKLDMYPNQHYDKLQNLIKTRYELQHKKDNLSVEKKYLTDGLKKLSSEMILYKELPDINGIIDFLEKVMFSIEKLISEIDESAQKDLSNSISKYFLDNSFTDYDEIIIDDYNISFLKSGFKINSFDLSNAERELLGLSLILSIHDSDNNTPLILDTPFMLLDTKNRELMINMLKEVNVQKILLLNSYEATNLSNDYKLESENGGVVILHGE